jgi:hypothetical protein
MIYDNTSKIISNGIKDICDSIIKILPETILPVYKHCLICGHYFTVNFPVGFHKCPHCGSILCL